jgi:hypothetical protein
MAPLPGGVTPVGKIGLQYSWSGQGRDFTPAGNLGDVPLVLPSSARQIYVQASRVSSAQIGAHLAAAHDKVLIVSISEEYAGVG